MNVYSIIIQKIFNRSKNIYAIKKMSNLKIKLPNLQNKLFIQPVLSSNIYTKYLNNQLWETIYINGELSIDLNENKSNNFLLIKYIFYLYIFNPIHNINRLNNTTNFIINKYKFFYNILNNPFYNESFCNELLSTICKIQKTYFALVKFVKICKHRVSLIYNTTDILMNPIKRYHHNVIEIIQNNKIYLFTRSDIINIMNAALSHSPNFFCEPLPIKNPYNNIIFKKSDLYNFYFFLRSSMFIISDLIQNYFLSNFNISVFQKNNEYIIREYYIKSYVENTSQNLLYSDIIYMLQLLKITKKIQIHPDFPKNILVKIMQPYLLLYYQSIYSIDLYKREVCADDLLMSLSKFINYNPQFGRQFIKLQKQIRSKKSSLKFKKYKPFLKKIVTFNTKHLPFYGKDLKFMISQTYCDYDNAIIESDNNLSESDNDLSESDNDLIEMP